MVNTIGYDTDKLCKMLQALRRQIVHRAWSLGTEVETFGDEIVALNDVDEAIRNNCGGDERLR